MQRQHDMGGMPAGPVEPDSPPTAPWAKLITATVGALREKKLMTVDEMRRALEDLPSGTVRPGLFRTLGRGPDRPAGGEGPRQP